MDSNRLTRSERAKKQKGKKWVIGQKVITFKEAKQIIGGYGMNECTEYENAWWFGFNAGISAADIPPAYGRDLVVYKKDGRCAPYVAAMLDNSMGQEIGPIPM